MSNHPSLRALLRQFTKISLNSIQFYSKKHAWVVDHIVASAHRKFVIKQELRIDELDLFLFVCEEYCRILRKNLSPWKAPICPICLASLP